MAENEEDGGLDHSQFRSAPMPDQIEFRPAPMPDQIMEDGRRVEARAPHIIDVRTNGAISEFGLLRLLWGLDIWINGLPLIKLGVGLNVVIWILMWLALR